MKVNVFVAMFGGNVDTVSVFSADAAAINAWERYTGMSWAVYVKSNDKENFLGDKYQGTTLYEMNIDADICPPDSALRTLYLDLDYGMTSSEFTKEIRALLPDVSYEAIRSWIDTAFAIEIELDHSEAKSLMEFYAEFSIIKRQFCADIALQLFNLGLERNLYLFNLLGMAKLLQQGISVSEIYSRLDTVGIFMTEDEERELSKEIKAYVNNNC